MSRSASVRRFFGDADHDFRLNIGELEALDEQFECGVVELSRMVEDLRVRAIKAVLRLGRVGAGCSTEEAYRWVERHVTSGELGAAAIVALAVLNGAIAGEAVEPAGESKGSETADLRSPTEGSVSRTSMPQGR